MTLCKVASTVTSKIQVLREHLCGTVYATCYTCRLFLRYKHNIFILGVLGFSKMTRSFPKIPEEVRSLPKMSKVFQSLRTGKNARLLPVLFTPKIRDHEEGIVIYSFYTWFSFLILVWGNIFLEILSRKTATTHIFQSCVRNWPRKREPVWDRSFQPAGVRLAPKVWDLAGISCLCYKTECWLHQGY